jgi:fatty acid desaturase
MRAKQIHLLSRTIICLVVVSSIGSLVIPISNPIHFILDILLRTYLIFVGTVMAHESVHGHLGKTRSTNYWWGRIALLPSMVPFTNFRRTHQLHHAFTNIPDRDPDHFMCSRNIFELVLRALAMPHHWFFWLRRRNRLQRRDLIELLLNYLAIVLTFSVILELTGPSRLFWGMAPPLVLVSVLLWYPFAVQTHEGFSTGSADSRSHDYYGAFMYWFSFGLSLHRVHHKQPKLSWIELRPFVRPTPQGQRRWLPQRDIQLDQS